MEKDVTRQIEEQLSAFLDGELPEEELALLVRRLERDQSHRATLERYALIGGSLRNDGDVAGGLKMRRGLMAALEDGVTDVAAPEVTVAQRSPLRYLLAASVLAGVVAVFVASNFPVQDQVASQQVASQPAEPPQVASPQILQQATVPVAAVVDSSTDVRRERHERELQRIRLKQERMRSYLISHGEYSSPLQGGIADSRMYVQQASYSE